MKWMFFLWLILTFAGPVWLLLSGQVDLKADYRTASRESVHIAPLPEAEPDAVIQVYAARAFNWRSMFASHCWIAVKPPHAASYTVYQVVGWNLYHGLPALSIQEDIPDRRWYDAPPSLIFDLRGEKAAQIIPSIHTAAMQYPYATLYRAWPGPNSNTFLSYIAREVPELGLVLPANALGKDYLPDGLMIARAPSGTGYQLSFFGLAGILVASKEGIEINLLGLTYGVRFAPFTLLLPGIGK